MLKDTTDSWKMTILFRVINPLTQPNIDYFIFKAYNVIFKSYSWLQLRVSLIKKL